MHTCNGTGEDSNSMSIINPFHIKSFLSANTPASNNSHLRCKKTTQTLTGLCSATATAMPAVAAAISQRLLPAGPSAANLQHRRTVAAWDRQMDGRTDRCTDDMHTICTSLQTDNHTNTSLLNVYRPDALPDAQPIASKH